MAQDATFSVLVVAKSPDHAMHAHARCNFRAVFLFADENPLLCWILGHEPTSVWHDIAFSFTQVALACVVIASLVPLSLLTPHISTALMARIANAAMFFVWLLPCMTLQHSTGVPLQLLHLDDALESGCLQSRTSVPRQGDSLNIVNVQIIACTCPR